MSGKGSKPRPFSVPRQVFENNWDRIFKKKEVKKKDTGKIQKLSCH